MLYAPRFVHVAGWAVRPGAARQNYSRKINAVAAFYLWPHSYFSRAAFEFISFGSLDDVFLFAYEIAGSELPPLWCAPSYPPLVSLGVVSSVRRFLRFTRTAAAIRPSDFGPLHGSASAGRRDSNARLLQLL
ncbi:Uncharacterized protein FWK35_00008799 [Aphis craccivora]|uniref:Uncharacterized protein n=1 Tax=Aphis craccivora TaxID=307492 RepID=A0A6G0ZHT0_APHCR|nr:Uncharacterized protein FWK35_00008799 [Aphis craccivora]